MLLHTNWIHIHFKISLLHYYHHSSYKKNKWPSVYFQLYFSTLKLIRLVYFHPRINIWRNILNLIYLYLMIYFWFILYNLDLFKCLNVLFFIISLILFTFSLSILFSPPVNQLYFTLFPIFQTDPVMYIIHDYFNYDYFVLFYWPVFFSRGKLVDSLYYFTNSYYMLFSFFNHRTCFFVCFF